VANVQEAPHRSPQRFNRDRPEPELVASPSFAQLDGFGACENKRNSRERVLRPEMPAKFDPVHHGHGPVANDKRRLLPSCDDGPPSPFLALTTR
jgi:hypothetical protein